MKLMPVATRSTGLAKRRNGSTGSRALRSRHTKRAPIRTRAVPAPSERPEAQGISRPPSVASTTNSASPDVRRTDPDQSMAWATRR